MLWMFSWILLTYPMLLILLLMTTAPSGEEDLGIGYIILVLAFAVLVVLKKFNL